MKYKIISDGRTFRVLVKGLWWQVLQEPNGWEQNLISFPSEKAAVDYVVKRYGHSCQRVREWRTV